MPLSFNPELIYFLSYQQFFNIVEEITGTTGTDLRVFLGFLLHTFLFALNYL